MGTIVTGILEIIKISAVLTSKDICLKILNIKWKRIIHFQVITHKLKTSAMCTQSLNFVVGGKKIMSCRNELSACKYSLITQYLLDQSISVQRKVFYV